MTDAQQALSDVTQARNGRTQDVAAGRCSLIAVSKTFEAAAIRPVLDAGHRAFGENRVQEAAGKWPALRQEYSNIDLHLIGPLQSNKARQAVQLFDAIHTIDRPKIAQPSPLKCRRRTKIWTCLSRSTPARNPRKQA